jgi:hypothetical protein
MLSQHELGSFSDLTGTQRTAATDMENVSLSFHEIGFSMVTHYKNI